MTSMCWRVSTEWVPARRLLVCGTARWATVRWATAPWVGWEEEVLVGKVGRGEEGDWMGRMGRDRTVHQAHQVMAGTGVMGTWMGFDCPWTVWTIFQQMVVAVEVVAVEGETWSRRGLQRLWKVEHSVWPFKRIKITVVSLLLLEFPSHTQEHQQIKRTGEILDFVT